MPLGLPTPMFLVFAATVLAGSLGAIHYLIVHVLLKRPFAEVPPPVLRESDDGGPARGAGPDASGPRTGPADEGGAGG